MERGREAYHAKLDILLTVSFPPPTGRRGWVNVVRGDEEIEQPRVELLQNVRATATPHTPKRSVSCWPGKLVTWETLREVLHNVNRAERERAAARRESVVSRTLQTLQDPILLTPWLRLVAVFRTLEERY